MESNYDNLYTIKYTEALSMVEMVWHRVATSEQFRQGHLLLLEQLQVNNAQNMLVDARRLDGFAAAEQGWLKDKLLPRLAHVGVKRMARITDPDIFMQVVDDNLANHVQTNLNFDLKSFLDRTDALEWLLQDCHAR